MSLIWIMFVTWDQGLYSLNGMMGPNTRSHEILKLRDDFSDPITLKFDSCLCSTAAEVPAIFQSDMITLTPNLVARKLHEIWW